MPARPDDDFDDDGRQPQARPGLPIDPSRLWASVRADWKWIPLAALIWGALGISIAYIAVNHSYRSEAVLIWEPASQGLPDQRVLATQAASIKLPVTLAKVRQKLKLPYPTRVLDAQVDVWFDMQTNLVTVQTGGPSQQEAQLLTRTVVEVFLENQTEIARARANDALTALEKDLKAARDQQAHARELYDEFRTKHGVTDIEEETRLAVAALSELRTEEQRAQTEAQALGARAETLGTLFKQQKATQVASTSSSNADAVRLNQLRTELATARARFSPDHPRLLALQSELAAFEARSKSSRNVAESVVTAANPEYQSLQSSLSTTRAEQQAAATRKASLSEFLQQTEQRVAALTAIDGKARTLMSDITIAGQRISDLEVQLASARDAVRSPAIEFRILTPASLPEWPERSKRRLIAMGMPIAGILVAIFALLLRPLRGGRIHTAREAAFWGNMPVVATSAWPRERDAFFALIDELGDDGRGARGFTLVLGASPNEKVLAEEIAYWLGGTSLGHDGKVEVHATPGVEAASAAPSMQAAVASAAGGSAGATGPAASSTTTASGATVSPGHALALVPSGPGASTALVAPRPQGVLNTTRAGTHAWSGEQDGPALRRAARAADRVLIVLMSGSEVFTALTNLRTRLGRDTGLALLLLGVGPELLHLPDRVGEVDRFWRVTSNR